MNDTNTTTDAIRQRLVNALTEYDRKQSTKRGYNHHALALYFEAVDEVMADVERGMNVQTALANHFNGRLLTVLQKAVQ